MVHENGGVERLDKLKLPNTSCSKIGAIIALTIALMMAPLLSAAQGDPLFLSDDPVEITIEMPMDTLIRDAEDKPVVPVPSKRCRRARFIPVTQASSPFQK